MSKDRRFELAIEKVLDAGWTQTEAAKRYGLSRGHVNRRVAQARQARVDAEQKAKIEHAEGKNTPTGLIAEKRRIPDNITDFVETYFTNWQCPDCEEHHKVPGFHREISEAARSKSRRTLINLPPYHSKSTVITVWDTVMSIAENPNHRTAVVSKSSGFASAFLHSISEILTNEDLYYNSTRNLIDDFGPFKPEGQSKWSATRMYVAGRTGAEKDPTVEAMGINNQIYGKRFDTIKFDDVADVENQRNPDRVAAMISKMDKEHLSRIGKNGKVIWVGTRVHPGDIYSILTQRAGYKVIRYPALFDDNTEEVLWPEHFPYSQVMIHRSEMAPADFQLIYQNVDIPGLGASFTQEMMDECKDETRVVGHYENGWRIFGGLDPAGGNKGSGFTAMTVRGIDPQTGRRYLIDQIAVKSMKAPQMKEEMLRLTATYPISEWRVEINGLQSQIIQYDQELVRTLALQGVKVVPHHTHTNKWDPEFGVEAQAPLYTSHLVSIPWGNLESRKVFQPLIEQYIAFPMGQVNDRVMSDWFAELACKEVLRRQHLPMFNARQRVPDRIRKRRRVFDMGERTSRKVTLEEQVRGRLVASGFGHERLVVGTPTDHSLVYEYEPETERGNPYEVEPDTVPVNIDPRIWERKS